MSATGHNGWFDPDRVQALFATARGLTQKTRSKYLTEACGNDTRLRLEVETLLAHDAAATEFLDGPNWRALARQPGPWPCCGEVVGPYRIESFLARGGTGQVFIASDLEADVQVALKIVAPVGLVSRARARILREVESAARVSHRHLVQVRGWGEDERLGLLYCAMRLVRGPTLADVLVDLVASGEAPSPPVRRQLVERVAEVAAALAALHAAGLVHRDVKPANIVLDAPDGKDVLACPAVLVDLGLVMSADAPGGASTLWASLDYAPPEQLLGRRVGPAGDVFALGVVAHDLLGGRRPEARRRASAERLASLRTLVPGIERSLAAVVAMATDPEPEWRYPDASALERDLRAALAGAPVAALRVPPTLQWLRGVVRARRATLRSALRVARGLAAGAVLLLLVQFAVAVAHSRRVAAAAWARGDLAVLATALREGPALAGMLLPSPVRTLAQAVGTDPSPLARVFAVGQQQGWPAALTLAARYLERDGCAAHPELTRFLVASVRAVPDPHALALLARVFFERPDGTDEDAAASNLVRVALHDALRAGLTPDLTMDAVVALGGCGDSSSLELLLSTAGACPPSPSDAGTECQRVTLHAIAALLRRQAGTRLGGRTLTETQRVALHGVARDALARLQGPGVGPSRMERAVSELEVEVALASAGSSALPMLPLAVPRERLFVLAARRDPGLRAELLAGADPLPLQPDASPSVEWSRAADFGFAAGLCQDSSCEAALRDLARRARDVPAADARFAQGLAHATAAMRGARVGDAPDASSQLGAGLDAAPPFLPCDAGVTALPTGTFAAADLWHGAPRLAGSAERLSLCAAEFLPDEMDREASYLCLARPGASAVAMVAVLPQAVTACTLRLWVQQGSRAALPWDGVGAFDILLDGQEVATGLRLRGTAAFEFRVHLCRVIHERRGEVVIRLSADATTTLRIYEVQLLGG